MTAPRPHPLGAARCAAAAALALGGLACATPPLARRAPAPAPAAVPAAASDGNADSAHTAAEVMAVVARETEAYYAEDFAAWRATYVDAPYFRLHGYWEGYAEPVVQYVGFDTLAAVKRRQFAERATLWRRSREERRNVNVRARGDVAWVTFEQDSYDAATGRRLGRSLEARVLERHGGRWQIAYLGYHYYPSPTPAPAPACTPTATP